MIMKDEEYFSRMGKRSGEAKREDMSNAQIRKELFRVCEQFIMDNQITCPETIWQCDGVVGNVYEFIEEICNVIGYASIEDINENDPEDRDN